MRTVLIADSDSFQRQLIDMLLAVDNYHLLGFETGRALLEHLQSQVPDLVILDYALPDINGADLCAKMKKVKRLANVPVILVTAAHKLELVRGVATAVRADLVLAKPLGDKHLREHVLKLLRPATHTPQPATPIHVDPILEQALEIIQTSPSQTLSPLLSSPTLPPVFTATQTYTPQVDGSEHPPTPKDGSSNRAITPVFIDHDEAAPFHLELPDTLTASSPAVPPNTFQEDANAALEALLGEAHTPESQSEPPTKDPQDRPHNRQNPDRQNHLLDTWGSSESIELADTDGAISEQELLESLNEPFAFTQPADFTQPAEHVLEVDAEAFQEPFLTSDTSPQLRPPPYTDTPAPDQTREPQAVPLGSKLPGSTPATPSSDFHSSLDETLSGIEAEMQALRSQVQQLSDENERLRNMLLELEQGQPLASSKSYLDAIEELELLRRLSDIQVKQLDSLQRQNQRLLEENQGSQERRRGLFGFLQPKNPS